MSALAILCPGQGAQSSQMFDLLPAQQQMQLDDWWRVLTDMIELAGQAALAGQAQDAVAAKRRATVGTAENALPGWRTLLQNPADMFRNRYAQPLVAAVSLAHWQALLQLCPALPAPQLLAGYSVGELSACALAGMFTPAQCLQLAYRRALAMDACVQTAHGMAALGLPPGLHGAALAALLDEVELAIENGARQWVVAGQMQAVQRLQGRAQALGASWQSLPVQIASHTSLMAGATPVFAAQLAQGMPHEPQIALLAGISAQRQTQAAQICTSLASQLSHTVRWADCMDALAEAGITLALELGPGCALTRLLQQRQPQIEVRSVAQFRSLGGVADWLQRHL